MTKLTSNDPEPPVFTVVRDDLGRTWRRWPEGYWLKEGKDEDDDPESWFKVAGNYGPVTIISEYRRLRADLDAVVDQSVERE